MRIVVSSQDSGGFSQDDFDANFLINFETYSVESIKAKTKDIYTSRGYPDFPFELSSEATYVESGLFKFAVIRILGSDKSSMVIVAGIIGSELIRVTCGKVSEKKIPITYGPCAEKIKDVFGVKIGS